MTTEEEFRSFAKDHCYSEAIVEFAERFFNEKYNGNADAYPSQDEMHSILIELEKEFPILECEKAADWENRCRLMGWPIFTEEGEPIMDFNQLVNNEIKNQIKKS